MTRWRPRSGGASSSSRPIPGVDLKQLSVPYGEDTTKLTAGHAAGTVPDMLYAYSQLMYTYGVDGLTQPVNDLIDTIGRDRFIPSALDGITVDGNIYTVPQTGFPFFIYYRKDLYEELGLTPPDDARASCSRTRRARPQPARRLRVHRHQPGALRHLEPQVGDVDARRVLLRRERRSSRSTDRRRWLRGSSTRISRRSRPRAAWPRATSSHASSTSTARSRTCSRRPACPPTSRPRICRGSAASSTRRRRAPRAPRSTSRATPSPRRRSHPTSLARAIAFQLDPENFQEYLARTVVGWVPMLQDAYTDAYLNRRADRADPGVHRARRRVPQDGRHRRRLLGPERERGGR